LLDIDYGGTIFAPLALAGTRHVRVGIGPGLLRSHWTYRSLSRGTLDRTTTRTFGWIGNAALAVPLGFGFEIGVTGQYRGFGATTVGPSPSGSAPLAAAPVRSAHSYVAAGLGLTF
jgi:hypothetical protein